MAWKDKIAFGSVIFLAASATSFGWWATVALFARPTEDKVIQLVETRAPYLQDRKSLMEAIARAARSEDRIIEVIAKNTEAINQLRIAMARIDK